MQAPTLSEEELNSVYNWVDEIPLSRPKKNIARDFCDGVLLAEIVHHYIPKLVEIHNYSPAHSTSAKLYNWNTLNQKVFKRIGFQISKTDIDNVIQCTPESVERVLKVVKTKLEKYLTNPPEEDYTQKTSPMSVGSGISSTHMDQKHYHQGMHGGNDSKDQTIQELKETVEILELKIKKLEQLVKLKDSKIGTLQNKLSQAGLA